jgi:hypothetical protein
MNLPSVINETLRLCPPVSILVPHSMPVFTGHVSRSSESLSRAGKITSSWFKAPLEKRARVFLYRRERPFSWTQRVCTTTLVTGQIHMRSSLKDSSGTGLGIASCPLAVVGASLHPVSICHNIPRRHEKLHWSKVSPLISLDRAPWSYCTLHRFSETESVVILTLLISQFRVKLPDEPQFAHETLEQKKERLFSSKVKITLTYVVSSL